MQTIRRRGWDAAPNARVSEKASRQGKANATPVDRRTWRRVNFMVGNPGERNVLVVGLHRTVGAWAVLHFAVTEFRRAAFYAGWPYRLPMLCQEAVDLFSSFNPPSLAP